MTAWCSSEGGLQKLVGKKVVGLFVEPGEGSLVFEIPNESIVINTYGDCCSETWFADILGVDALIGHTIVSVEEPEYGDNTDLQWHDDDLVSDDAFYENGEKNHSRSRQECDQLYGIKITTDAGYTDIVYRNSSNGYYGGNIDRVEVLDDEEMNAIKSKWNQITDDWSAN
jgi:hypothetical protein